MAARSFAFGSGRLPASAHRAFTGKRFPGDRSEGETPVPIPNTAVKPLSADGTALETVWESRSSPGVNFNESPRVRSVRSGAFAYLAFADLAFAR